MHNFGLRQSSNRQKCDRFSENFGVVFGQKSKMTVDATSEDNFRMSKNEYSEQGHE